VKKKAVNIAASFRARLLSLARERKEDFQFVLSRWMIERLLYRLSISPHQGSFVLKGAMLFAAWTGRVYRPTRDLDLLGYGTPDINRLVTAFREVCAIDAGDGLLFEPSRIEGERIKEVAEYEGVRVRIPASLDGARQLLQIDVGLGDAVEPPPAELTFPVLLPADAPQVRAYPPEAVVAEKLQAMVQLGIANSRMKDFYDLCTIAESLSFDLPTLARSVRLTFERRRTPVPTDPPSAFMPEFLEDASKRAQRQAFIKRTGPYVDLTLAQVGGQIREFLLPILQAASAESPAARRWEPGGPWR
jgi:hypothetical protein